MVQSKLYSKRLNLLLLFFVIFLGILAGKLFFLQVLRHGYYMEKALADHQGYTELEPRRGEIYIQDYHSNESFKVATNTTLDTVFADPYLIEDPLYVADQLYVLLFQEDKALREEELRLKEQRKTLPAELTEEEINQVLKPKSVEELRLEFRDELISKISQKVRQEILLVQDPEDNVKQSVKALGLSGVEVQDKAIYVYPPKISDTKVYSAKLAPYVDIDPVRLESLLKGTNRYTVLATQLEPQKSQMIRELVEEEPAAYKGIGFDDKSYRFYPEGNLASQIIGFLDSERDGIYGIEEAFDDLLSGEEGVFKTKLDAFGKQITVGADTLIRPAKDGSNVHLTIERSVQKEAERLIEKAVEETQADSGQMVVMNPHTGELIAVAQYPNFDPNEFWKALDTEEYFFENEEGEPLSEEELEERIVEYNYGGQVEMYYIEDEENNKEVRILPVQSVESGNVYYETYKNGVGPGAYRNRVVVDQYEPGSVFKPISMSAGMDAGVVTPNTTMEDNGPIKVDEFLIDNALSKHYGIQTMTQVLENSNNVGMAWLGLKMGRSLLGSYLKKYGFGRRTDIQFDNEQTGKVKTFTAWADSELATYMFGQGLTATPVQVATAFSTLANGGLLMQPTIVDRIEHSDGKVDEFEPSIVRRVISKRTADTMIAMLTSVVHNGQADAALVNGYMVAGKTGTSQTYKNGIPQEGPGTTIASFAGFAPASDPQFVVLVKVDRPRTAPWGSVVAAPIFAEMTNYILNYFNVPPDSGF